MPRFFWLLALAAASAGSAQSPVDIARERTDFGAWLDTSAVSPLRAIVQRPLDDRITLGPTHSDILIPGLQPHRISSQRGAWVLEGPDGRRQLARGRPIRITPYTLLLTGSPDRTFVTVFGPGPAKPPPGHYSYDSSLVFTGPLSRIKGEKTRILAPNGLPAEALEVGTFLVPLAGGSRLAVRRIQTQDGEESELEIFFQDKTNGKGSYPAGRFVSLIPLGSGRYSLDFNRARNPFCAYSSAYPCPVPWRGNLIGAPVKAGEQYGGGGLEPPTGVEGS